MKPFVKDEVDMHIAYVDFGDVKKIPVYQFEEKQACFDPFTGNRIDRLDFGNVKIEKDCYVMPDFPIPPEFKGYPEYLKYRCQEGLKKKLKTPSATKGNLSIRSEGVEIRNKTYIQVCKQDDTQLIINHLISDETILFQGDLK